MFSSLGFVLNTKTNVVNTFVESVGVQPCCQTMNGLVVPRWDLWMSNRDFFESWLHVQMRDSPGCDLTYQVLVFLDRLFMAGLKLHGEDHRDVFTNPEDFWSECCDMKGNLDTPYEITFFIF